MGISRIFDMSTRSLATYQKALEVTSHNIANSSNENYTRQVSVFTSTQPEMNGGFIWGTGVKLEQVQRVRDDLVDRQIYNYNQNYSNSQTQLEYLSQIEQVFSEPSDLGLGSLINEFFSSWNELAVSPSSNAMRNNVINSAQNLVSKSDEITDQLNLIKTDIRNQFDSKIGELNQLLSEVKGLNDSIYTARLYGAEPNDLLDSRDACIEQISELVNCTVSYDNKGGAIISVGGIVAINDAFSVEFTNVSTGDELTLVAKDSTNEAALTGGSLFALKDIYDNKLPDYQQSLSDITSTIAAQVNAIHSTGYTITSPAQTGIKFFEETTDGSLKINSAILNDPNMIAVSEDGLEGNGNLANKIAALADSQLLNGSTISEKYNSLINTIGSDTQLNERQTDAAELIIEQLKNLRSSQSGVSLDEEMANILKYQRSYDAAAKLIKIADEMLDSLMQII